MSVFIGFSKPFLTWIMDKVLCFVDYEFSGSPGEKIGGLLHNKFPFRFLGMVTNAEKLVA